MPRYRYGAMLQRPSTARRSARLLVAGLRQQFLACQIQSQMFHRCADMRSRDHGPKFVEQSELLFQNMDDLPERRGLGRWYDIFRHVLIPCLTCRQPLRGWEDCSEGATPDLQKDELTCDFYLGELPRKGTVSMWDICELLS